MLNKVLGSIAIITIVIIIYCIYESWMNCTSTGGVLVRGIIGYECVRR